MTSLGKITLLSQRKSLELALRDLESGKAKMSGPASGLLPTEIGGPRLDTIEHRIASVKRRIAQIDDQLKEIDNA